jgi:arylsulfatase A-like enzyme
MNLPPATSFRHYFKIWGCFLVYFFLPLDLLYRLDALLLCTTPWEVMVNTAAMTLIMLVLAAVISLVSVVISVSGTWVTIGGTGKSRSSRTARLPSITSMVMVVFASANFSFYLKILFLGAGPVSLSTKILFFSVVLAFFTLTSHAVGTKPYLPEAAASLGRLLPTVTLLAVLVVICGMVTHRYKTPPPVAARKGIPAAPGPKKPNLIVISFDALSAEDMSLYGYHLNTTPNLNEFAAKSFVFDNAIATANWTRPSVASLLTGKYPSSHRLINTGVYSNRNEVPKESLPALLKDLGFVNTALVANWSYAHPYVNGTYEYFDHKGLTGITFKNLRFYDYCVFKLWELFLPLQDRYNIGAFLWLGELINEYGNRFFNFTQMTDSAFPARTIFDQGADLAASYTKENPGFLWLHVLPPHAPYLPPAPFKGRFSKTMDSGDGEATGGGTGTSASERLRLAYDEFILSADSEFRSLLQSLQRSGRLEDSIIIVTADHGESFGHGYQGHGGPQLYQQMVHIPLIIHLPGQVLGKRVTTTVSQADIAPTLLDLLGRQAPAWMEGQSLKPAMDDQQWLHGPVFTMNVDGNATKGKVVNGSAAVFQNGFKYVYDLHSHKAELYNLRNDPKEKIDLTGREPALAREMYLLISNMLDKTGNQQGAAPK